MKNKWNFVIIITLGIVISLINAIIDGNPEGAKQFLLDWMIGAITVQIFLIWHELEK